MLSEDFSRSLPVTGEPVVTDNRTGRMWQGCASGMSGTLTQCSGSVVEESWEDSLSYCEGLTWGGFSDWRMPNREEFASIIDITVSEPAVDNSAFPDTPASDFWTSSPLAHYIDGYTMRIQNGILGLAPPVVPHSNLCVRGGH